MPETSHVEMHLDHQRWLQEADLWRDGVRVWESELAAADQNLSRLGETLRSQIDTLRTYAGSIRLYRDRLATEEAKLAACECAHDSGEPSLSQHYTAHQAEHDRRAAEHEAIKQRHHNLMAHWNALVKTAATMR
ncbi:MAG TPA: hypothetical protein VG713_11825 [Pirellulales bacterium]|nr:hypothetical protein [Pirellulales bacterium]